jgi:sortase (surface protein transpeptidase)
LIRTLASERVFRRAALACWVAILLLVLAISVFGSTPAGPARAAERPKQQEPAMGTAGVDTQPEPVAPQKPGRLIIRSIGVDAPIVALSVDKDGAMDIPKRSFDVGWYSPGVVPGEPGDAVMDGHLDWYDTSRAVFYNLSKVKLGDTIDVQRFDGVVVHFRVSKVSTVAYDARVPGLFASTGPPRLSLITCGGSWSQKLGQYLSRVIVDATLIT